MTTKKVVCLHANVKQIWKLKILEKKMKLYVLYFIILIYFVRGVMRTMQLADCPWPVEGLPSFSLGFGLSDM